MSTLVGTDVEILELLDFEESKACENPQGCSEVATFLVIHNCCGFSYQMCTPCTARARDFIRRWEARGVQLGCKVCGLQNTPAPSFVPLGGAS